MADLRFGLATVRMRRSPIVSLVGRWRSRARAGQCPTNTPAPRRETGACVAAISAMTLAKLAAQHSRHAQFPQRRTAGSRFNGSKEPATGSRSKAQGGTARRFTRRRC
jgi:hypothetical protein